MSDTAEHHAQGGDEPQVPETARAVQFDEYGDIDVLQVREVPVTRPTGSKVLVQVRAAGINPGELAIRCGAMQEQFPGTLPSGQGTDFAGTVVAIGDEVRDIAVGEDVLGWTYRRASQAEYVLVPAKQLVPKPADVDWNVAGSLFIVGATAWAAVHAVNLGSGDTVVVSGAAGGVGTVVVQLAALAGAHVIGIASESNHEWLRSLGAEALTYGDGLADRIRDAAPSGVDALIDTFGGGYVDLGVELGLAPERIETIIDFDAAQRVGAQAKGSTDATSGDVLAELVGLVASGKLDVPIAETFPLDRVRDAYEELAKRHTHGKIVLIP